MDNKASHVLLLYLTRHSGAMTANDSSAFSAPKPPPATFRLEMKCLNCWMFMRVMWSTVTSASPCQPGRVSPPDYRGAGKYKGAIGCKGDVEGCQRHKGPFEACHRQTTGVLASTTGAIGCKGDVEGCRRTQGSCGRVSLPDITGGLQAK